MLQPALSVNVSIKHLFGMKKRWGGKMKPNREVSRWLLQVRRETADEAPLVVPKVIRQYTRKKKVSPAEPTNEPVSIDVATECSEQNVSEVKVDNHNHVKIKEEYIPDIKILNVGVENDVHRKEQNASESKNSALTLDINCDIIKKENLDEIKIIKGNNAQQICPSKVKNTVKTKQENVSKKPSNSQVSEREQDHSRMDIDITVKMESVTTDDSEYTDLDQKNIAGCHLEEGKAFRVKPETNTIKCDSYNTSDKMDEGKNVELEIMDEENHLQGAGNKNLLTEEINIKDEIESDSDDSEIAVTSNNEVTPVDAVTAVEQLRIMGVTDGSQLVTQGNGDVFKTTRKKPDLTLKKCYLVAVDLAPSTSGIRRHSSHSKPVALLTANSQQVVDPENLAGFKVVAKSQIFTCDMCSDHFLSKTSLHKHMRGKHSVATNYQCHCGSRFSHNYLLLAHKRTHTGSLACDLCPKSFSSTQKFSVHLNTHLRERLYSCPVCGRRYPVLFNLQRHAARHKTSDIFQCALCSESYRSTFDLRRHSERVHNEKVDYPCYVCDQTLSSNAEHLAHIKSHDNALHECAFCSMRFTDAHKWEEHSAVHIERLDAVAPVLMPYVCGVCKKRFEFRCSLRTHMRSHTGERPYKCKECHKTFKTGSAVSEHERGHNRPYPCTECPARFAKRETLSRHLLLHSGERPHACPSCGRAFTQRSAMRQHVQRFHTPGLKRAKAGRKKTNKWE